VGNKTDVVVRNRAVGHEIHRKKCTWRQVAPPKKKIWTKKKEESDYKMDVKWRKKENIVVLVATV
jgi:hypothetical protein